MKRKSLRRGRGKAKGVNGFSDVTTQRKKLLAALNKKPINTLYARNELDIMHPGARILELRSKGHKITTYRHTIKTPGGYHHHVALYVLTK